MAKCKFCRKPGATLKPTGKMSCFCNFECFKNEGLKLVQKAEKIRIKDENQEQIRKKKEFYSSDIKWQHKTCKTAFNKSRVLQELKWFKEHGLEPECISCGKKNMDWCCGHFKTVGASGALRYSRLNTFLQCNKYCNMSLSGNISGNKNTRGYINGLLERFGKNKGQRIIDLCEKMQHKTKKWSCEEVVLIKNKSLSIAKSIKQIKKEMDK